MNPFESKNTYEKYLIERAGAQYIPLNGTLELSPLCNMNCDMCYVRMDRAEMEAKGRLRTADEWLALGRQMQEAGTLFLLLTGGEPLLYPEFEKLYLGLQELGFILSVNTNGTMLDEKWADFFAEHRPRRINITLYGGSVATYEKLCHYGQGFEKTLQAVKLLRARNVDVKLSCSAVQANKAEIGQILTLGAELGVPVNTDVYMMPACRERSKNFDLGSRLSPEEAAETELSILKLSMGDEDFRAYCAGELEKIKNPAENLPEKGLSCLAGTCSFAVNWQGKLRPCVMLPFPETDLMGKNFALEWATFYTFCADIPKNPECVRCEKRALCRACAASAYWETGAADGKPEYHCRMTEGKIRKLQK